MQEGKKEKLIDLQPRQERFSPKIHEFNFMPKITIEHILTYRYKF